MSITFKKLSKILNWILCNALTRNIITSGHTIAIEMTLFHHTYTLILQHRRTVDCITDLYIFECSCKKEIKGITNQEEIVRSVITVDTLRRLVAMVTFSRRMLLDWLAGPVSQQPLFLY